MRIRCCYLVIIFLVISFVFPPVIMNVNASWWASQQPAVCWWPSKTMSMYFDFQDEVKTILFWWSKVNEKRFWVTNNNKWLFSNKVLDLPLMDTLAYSVLWSLGSAISTTTTSVVLLLLASASVGQSSVDGLVILFKDRPIVRDYKYMLDIETELFDIAYFRSKQVNLTRPFDSEELLKKFLNIIEKYQDLWLFEKTGRKPTSDVSIADVLFDLLSMNSAMRNFIVFRWDSILSGYNWCLWSVDNNECDSDVSILRFNSKAIAQLDEDYRWIWAFWACNLYASNFKNTISKSTDDNLNSVKDAMQDVSDAWVRLWEATVGWIGKGRWKLFTDPCNMSEYEMAQLRAYWWWNWECWEWIGLSTIYPKTKNWVSSAYWKTKSVIEGVKNWLSSAYGKIKEYIRQKKVERERRKQQKALLDSAGDSKKVKNKNWKPVLEEIESKSDTQDKQAVMTENFWSWEQFNPNFSYDILSDFLSIYTWIMADYKQSQESASESDLSYELKKIRWLLDQIDAVNNQSEILEKDLKKIADYQCNG